MNNNINVFVRKHKYAFLFTILILLIFVLLCLIRIIIKNDSFKVYESEINMYLDDTYKIKLINYSGYSNYFFYSEDKSIASVDKDGNIHTNTSGSTEILVKSKFGFKINRIKLNVSSDKINSISFNNTINVSYGDNFKLNLLLNNSNMYNSNIKYISDDADIAIIDEYNNVIPTGVGSTYIYGITNNNLVYKTNVIVNDNNGLYNDDIRKIFVNPNNVINIKDYFEYNKEYKYFSDNDEAATIDKKGNIKIKSSGSTYIRYIDKNNNEFILCNIISSNKDENFFAFNSNYLELYEGYNKELTLFDSYLLSNEFITWSSDNEEVASVSENGTIYAYKEGFTNIHVKSINGNEASLTLRVLYPEINVNFHINNNVVSEKYIYNENDVFGFTDGKCRYSKCVDGNDGFGKITIKNTLFLGWGLDSDDDIPTYDTYYEVRDEFINKVSKMDNHTIDLYGLWAKYSDIFTDVYVKSGNNQLIINEAKYLNYNFNLLYGSVSFSSSNPSILTIDKNGRVKALKVGTSKINLIFNNKIIKSIKVSVTSKNKAIYLENKNYFDYIKDIEVYHDNSGISKHVQNFAIYDIGKPIETIYLSSSYKASLALDTDDKKKKIIKAVNESIIVKISKYSIRKNEFLNNNIMKIYGTGHGQSFDIDSSGNYIWTGADGNDYRISGNRYRSNSRSIMRTTFKSGTYSYKDILDKKLTPTNKNNDTYNNPEAGFDFDNNLILVRYTNKIYVYNYNEFINNNKKVLLYSFDFSKKAVKNSSIQGVDISNGYIYILYGKTNEKNYIQCYNLVGQLLYTKKFNFDNLYKKTEVEGIKIYNNKVYIGYVHNSKSVKGYVYNIGYFK